MFKLTAEEIKAIKNNAIYNNHENDKYIYYVNESGTYFAYVISEEVYNLIFNPAVVTEGTITCGYTTDSSFGPDYAQGFRITEFTPSGEEVNQDLSWKGYTVGNTIHIFCEDGVADISKYVIEWRMYNADRTSYTVFAENDHEATFIMPAYDVRIEVKVIYQSTPEHTSHNYTIPVGSRDASCTEQAYVIYKCDSCEDTYTEWGEGPLGHDWKNAEGKCTICEETHPHDWSDNNGVCKTCRYECSHTNPDGTSAYSGWMWDEQSDGHYRFCTICNKPDGEPGNHNSDYIVDNKDGTHSIGCDACWTEGLGYYIATTENCEYTSDTSKGTTATHHACSVCGHKEKHNYVNGACQDCGYVCTPHDWQPVNDYDPTMHLMKCSICGEEGGRNYHVWEVVGDKHKCSECEYEEAHNFTKQAPYDASHHYLVCAQCGQPYEDADGNQVASAHMWENGTCKICGYECKHPYESIKYSTTGDTHTKICGLCGTELSSPEQHNWDDAHECTVCGYSEH
jgi:hypothetical protein